MSASSSSCEQSVPVASMPVAVALCTYRGAAFVEAQVQSLQAQSWPVSLHISDDASDDDTVANVQALVRLGVDTLSIQETNSGYVKNFQAAIQAALDTDARHIALSDQDDIWHIDRIERGMRLMNDLEHEHGLDTPLLVHSDLRLIDTEGLQTSPSFLDYRQYRITTEKNLLVVLGENGVMGNTILMNRALANLCLPFPDALHVHDYWIALMAELFGQRALLSEPTVDYRLHGSNASNTATSMQIARTRAKPIASLKKLLAMDFKLPYKEDSRRIALLDLLDRNDTYPALNDDQRRTLMAFVDYLTFEQPRWRSLLYLMRSGVVRPGLRNRCRLCLVTLFTRRYNRTR